MVLARSSVACSRAPFRGLSGIAVVPVSMVACSSRWQSRRAKSVDSRGFESKALQTSDNKVGRQKATKDLDL